MKEKTIPATAGLLITEEEFRAYTKCSEFFHFGGLVSNPIQLDMLKRTVEWMLLGSLKQNIKNPMDLLSQSIAVMGSKIKKEYELAPNEMERICSAASIHVGEVFRILKPQQYRCLTGPLVHNIRIHSTVIQLCVSGTFRSNKNQTIHVLSFAPYSSAFDTKNDPLSHLKARFLKDLVSNLEGKRPQTISHVFSLHTKQIENIPTLYYSNVTSQDASDTTFHQIETLVRCMEMDHHYPITPCPFACPYKKECQPGLL